MLICVYLPLKFVKFWKLISGSKKEIYEEKCRQKDLFHPLTNIPGLWTTYIITVSEYWILYMLNDRLNIID